MNCSRAEASAATRKGLMCCSQLQRLGCEAVGVLRSARPKGKKCRSVVGMIGKPI